MLHGHDSQDVAHSPCLPVELVEIIFHTVKIDAEEHEDTETVKACSLVSSSWREFFQAALLEMKGVCLTFSNGTTPETRFGVRYVMLDSQRKKAHALCDLLDVNPFFGKAISRLALQIVDEDCLGDSKSGLTVAPMLSLMTNVKTLSFSRFDSDNLGAFIDRRKFGSWAIFSPSLKTAIADLFRSPSLRNLTVASFDGPLDVMLPRGAEIDTLTLGAGVVSTTFFASTKDVDAYTTDSVLPTQVSSRPCIVRHLVASAPCAANLLVAVTRSPHPHQNIRTFVVDSSALYSFKGWGKPCHLYSPASQLVLKRATNLKKFAIYAGQYSLSLQKLSQITLNSFHRNAEGLRGIVIQFPGASPSLPHPPARRIRHRFS